MKFSKCEILQSGTNITIKFKDKKRERKIFLKKSEYKQHATFKKRRKVEINRWVLFITLLALLVAWVSFSEHMGNIKGTINPADYAIWKRTDNIGMPLLMILTFITFFFDILGDVKGARFILGLPFNRNQMYLVIILTTNVEFEVPVKNKKEAQRIVNTFLLKTN